MTINVLHIIDCLYDNAGGGTERQFIKLYQCRKTIDINPHIIFLRREPCHDQIQWNIKPLTLHVSSIWHFNFLSSIKKIVQYINDKDIEVIHSTFDDATILAALINKMKPSIPFIASLRNSGHNHHGLKMIPIKWAYRQADLLAVNAHRISEYLQTTFSIDKSAIRVIGNIVDEDKNQKLSEQDLELVSKFKRNFQFTAILTANLKPIKGINDLFVAIELVKTRIDIGFFLLGDGGDLNAYKDKAVRMGISDSICFIGRRDSVTPFLKQVDIALLPSHSEGLSNSLIEYLYNGLPVIATAVGGNSELLNNGEFGTLVSPKNPSSLADALCEVTNHLEQARQKAQRGQEFTLQAFNSESICKKYNNLYEHAISLKKQ